MIFSSQTDKPHNPLVNAGSIAVNALLYSLVKPKMSSSEKFDFLQQYFRVCVHYLIWKSPSLSELLFNTGLTHLGSEASIYDR